MDEKKIALTEDQLTAATGGSHLSSDEVKSLPKGIHLIWESPVVGRNFAEVEYLGEYKDPGPLSMLELKVRLLKTFNLSVTTSANIGDEVWVSRWNLDFIERA